MNTRRETFLWSIAITTAISLGLIVVWGAIMLAFAQPNLASLYFVPAPYIQDDYSPELADAVPFNPLDPILIQEAMFEDQARRATPAPGTNAPKFDPTPTLTATRFVPTKQSSPQPTHTLQPVWTNTPKPISTKTSRPRPTTTQSVGLNPTRVVTSATMPTNVVNRSSTPQPSNTPKPPRTPKPTREPKPTKRPPHHPPSFLFEIYNAPSHKLRFSTLQKAQHRGRTWVFVTVKGITDLKI